jgi:class 3 adenylate cyclase
LADWNWSPLLESMRMSRRGEIGPSSAVKTPEPFAAERALRRRKIINKIMNVIVVVGIAIDLFFAILYSVLDARAYAIAIGVNLATAGLWALTPLFQRWPDPFAGVWFLGVFIVAMLSFTLLLGHASGSHLFLILVAIFSLIFLGPRPIVLPVLTTLVAWGAFVVAAKVLPRWPSHIPMLIDESEALFYATSALTICVLFLTTRYSIHLVDTAEAALEREFHRSDALLLNVLPAPVAERLKSGERIADGYKCVSVLFADIVGFTAAARQAGPEATVGMLNRFFSVADELAQRLSCEKIKTIGDCVMVAAGLPEPSSSHAETLARYALDLRDMMDGETFASAPLELRIGIHSGPAVAGVIGRSRFAYDLWGDTVNVASRIQHAANPDEIQLSNATRELLSASFSCTAAGEVETRGAGRVGVWRLDRELERLT